MAVPNFGQMHERRQKFSGGEFLAANGSRKKWQNNSSILAAASEKLI